MVSLIGGTQFYSNVFFSINVIAFIVAIPIKFLKYFQRGIYPFILNINVEYFIKEPKAETLLKKNGGGGDISLSVGQLIPLFWNSGDVSSGFQSQSGQFYSRLAEAYVIWNLCNKNRNKSRDSLLDNLRTHLLFPMDPVQC